MNNIKLSIYIKDSEDHHHHIGKRQAEIPAYCARRPKIVTGPKAGQILNGIIDNINLNITDPFRRKIGGQLFVKLLNYRSLITTNYIIFYAKYHV